MEHYDDSKFAAMSDCDSDSFEELMSIEDVFKNYTINFSITTATIGSTRNNTKQEVVTDFKMIGLPQKYDKDSGKYVDMPDEVYNKVCCNVAIFFRADLEGIYYQDQNPKEEGLSPKDLVKRIESFEKRIRNWDKDDNKGRIDKKSCFVGFCWEDECTVTLKWK